MLNEKQANVYNGQRRLPVLEDKNFMTEEKVKLAMTSLKPTMKLNMTGSTKA